MVECLHTIQRLWVPTQRPNKQKCKTMQNNFSYKIHCKQQTLGLPCNELPCLLVKRLTDARNHNSLGSRERYFLQKLLLDKSYCIPAVTMASCSLVNSNPHACFWDLLNTKRSWGLWDTTSIPAFQRQRRDQEFNQSALTIPRPISKIQRRLTR